MSVRPRLVVGAEVEAGMVVVELELGVGVEVEGGT